MKMTHKEKKQTTKYNLRFVFKLCQLKLRIGSTTSDLNSFTCSLAEGQRTPGRFDNSATPRDSHAVPAVGC